MRKCLPELADDLCLLPRSLSSVAGDFAVLNLATLFFKFSGNSEAGLGRLDGAVKFHMRLKNLDTASKCQYRYQSTIKH